MSDRKKIPVYRGVMQYFPDAIKEISKVSYAATQQHHPNKEMFWDRDKSNDHYDAMLRHLIDHEENPIDDDQQLHLAKVAWRALAGLQVYLESIKRL